MTQEFQNRSQTVPSSPKSTISKWTQTCLLQLLIKCITNLILLSIFPTGLNNVTCDINHRMSCDRTTITFHIFKCVKFIKQCKSSIVAFFSKKSTKASRIQSSWSPVWTVVARVCLSLRFMLMKLYSVAITHARQICPLRTLSNHHPAEGPSHTCDLPRLDSPTWGVRKRVFLAVSGCLCGVSLLSAPLSGAGIYRDYYQSRFHWDAVCVCVGKQERRVWRRRTNETFRL